MKKHLLALCVTLTSHIALQAAPIDTTKHPTIGDPNAPVQVIAFLEPKCPDSKRYSDDSFPKLKREYIDSQKIRYTVITTSFLFKSMPAAIALLCVYNQDPAKPDANLFFSFLDYIYKHQLPERQDWATTETLLQFASQASPSINIGQLKHCIEKQDYRSQITKNTAFGNQMMGHISTPTIFVDGERVENTDDTIDYEKLKRALEQALQRKAARNGSR